MEATAELAGLITAEAVLAVSSGETLVPILAYETPDGKREETRLAVDDGLVAAVAQGRESLKTNERGAARAVLVSDGYLTLPSGKIDALVIEAREYGPQPRGFTMALPYRHASKPEGFAVHKPKFLAYEGPKPDYEAVGRGFFRGVEQHEEGAKIWSERLDESM